MPANLQSAASKLVRNSFLRSLIIASGQRGRSARHPDKLVLTNELLTLLGIQALEIGHEAVANSLLLLTRRSP